MEALLSQRVAQAARVVVSRCESLDGRGKFSCSRARRGGFARTGISRDALECARAAKRTHRVETAPCSSIARRARTGEARQREWQKSSGERAENFASRNFASRRFA